LVGVLFGLRAVAGRPKAGLGVLAGHLLKLGHCPSSFAAGSFYRHRLEWQSSAGEGLQNSEDQTKTVSETVFRKCGVLPDYRECWVKSSRRLVVSVWAERFARKGLATEKMERCAFDCNVGSRFCRESLDKVICDPGQRVAFVWQRLRLSGSRRRVGRRVGVAKMPHRAWKRDIIAADIPIRRPERWASDPGFQSSRL